jgi:hypothetical protein
MRRIVMGLAAAGVIAGSLTGVQTANAAQPSNATPSPTHSSPPIITALDCHGTTGNMGCGPGFFWRDGWRGWACYPC